MEGRLILALRKIAVMGGLHDFISISSRELGEALGMSQQSASKRILELLGQGWIIRDLGARRQRIKLTDKGMEALRREYSEYQRIFETRDHVLVHGEVVTGMGEGQYYVNQEGYQEQFLSLLGFKPYEGTRRTFGEVLCHLADIQNIDCAVVVPIRSHYEDIIEVICKYHLRRTLGLKDGDVVEVRIHID
jgi:riboflavin kinase